MSFWVAWWRLRMAVDESRRALSAVVIELGIRLLPDEEERALAYVQLVYEGLLPPYEYGKEVEE